MKTIERLIRKNATEAGTWEPTHYTSLRQARQLNPNEYANSFRVNVETRPSAAIDRAYDGQAHYMSKAAHSLANMLNGLDYGKFSDRDANDLTASFHQLLNFIVYMNGKAAQDSERLTVTRPDGQVVNVTVPEREE